MKTVICTYRVAKGREEAFLELLERHWPTLHRLGLVTEVPSRVFRGVDEAGGTFFVELFEWKEEGSAGLAEQHPEVSAIWKPMADLVEDRLGQRGMEFPHVEPVPLSFTRG